MLPEIVAEAADRHGERAAFVAPGGWEVSYAELHRLSDEAAAGLHERGVGEGDVVALLLPSSPDYVVAYAAAAKVGAVTAGVNPRLAPPERAAVVAAARPTLTLASGALLPPGERGRVLEVEPAGEAGEILAPLRLPGRRPPELADDPDRAVAIVFTSGTTGTPKGAEFANRQLEAVAEMDTAGQASWGAGGDSVAATQFAHVGTMTKLPWQLRAGTTTHLLARWRPGEALELLARLEVPVVAGVPPQLALMLRHPSFSRHDWGHVQGIVVGGGPVTPALAQEAMDRFGAPMSIRYSSTESGGVGTGTAFDAPADELLNTVGRPRGTVELSIRLPDDLAQEAAPGDEGEVCFRSGAVCSGYHGLPEATAELFTADGFVRMGDLGRLDQVGALRLVGRSSDMFVRGGYNVHPQEVEAVLSRHPAVGAVAVVPRPDEVMGEIGVAVVEVAPGHERPTLEDLRAFAAAHLAAHKLPEAVEVTGDLPLTPMEKLDRRELARRFG